MARNDIFVNINAISPADAFVTGQQDMTAADVPELILGDTPTFNFYFTDNTNTWPSWAGNAAYTVTWALSDAVSGDFAPAATTGNATPITGGWSIDLPLNAYDLVGLLNSKRISQAYPVTYLWQQIRVTAPSGKEVTRAMVYTPIRYRAISNTQNTESATPTGGRFVTVNNTNDLTTPTLAQFYDANPVPASALPLGLGTDTAPANGELLIGNGTGYVTSTLTAGTGVTITNGAGSITIDASGAQELLTATVKNAEAVPITKGQVVYLYSATGNMPSVKLAANTSDATSAKTFGVVSSTSIAANGTGTVTCVGVVDGLNLGAYNDGDTVYLGATAGTITATKPYAPNHLVYVGIIERANAGNGELYVKVQNGYELDEIHDVQITSAPAAGALLMRDATNSLWKANRLSAGTNIAVTNADTSVTIGLTGTVAVANGGTGVTTSTGSGSVVLSTSPSLTTPILGTPQSGTLTNCTGLPVSTGVSGLGSGVATFLATPTSANLRTVVTDETGTGALVFANTPSLVTPDIGAATGTSATLTGNANVSDVRLGGTSGPSAKSSIAARAARQGLVFDGTQVAGTTSVPAFGTAAFTASAIISPTFTSNGTYIFGGASGAFDLFVDSSGVLNAGKVGVSAISSGTTLTAGKYVLVTYVRTSTSASGAAFYVNGVQVATVTDANDYTTAITLIGNAVTSTSAYQFVGGLEQPIIYNRALSAAEVVALYEAGVPSGGDYATPAATNTNQITGDAWWDTKTGSVSSGTLTMTSGQYILRGAVLTKGKRYRTTYNVTALTGTVYVGNTSAGTPVLQTLTSGAGSFEFTANDSGAFGFNAVSGTATVTSVTFIPVGLLLAPDAAQAGGGLTWYDTSGNAANITLPASGVTWNVPTSGKVATSLNVNAAASLFASTSNSTSISDVDTTAAFITKGSGTPRLYFGNDNAANRPFLQAGVGGGALFMTVQPYGGNVLIGSLTDGGQKLQVAGTAYVSGSATLNNLTVASSASGFDIRNASSTAGLSAVYGGSAYNNGAGITLGGSTHSTYADTILFTTGAYVEAARITSSGATFAGTVTATVNKSAANYTTVTTYVAAGSSTTTVHTFANANTNRSWLVSTRQQGAASNTVIGFATTYGGTLVVYRIAQSNTTGGVLDMNFTASGLNLQLVLGSGFGSTTWDTTITPIQG